MVKRAGERSKRGVARILAPCRGRENSLKRDNGLRNVLLEAVFGGDSLKCENKTPKVLGMGLFFLALKIDLKTL